MKTRNRAKEISTRGRVARRSRANTPDIADDTASDRTTPDRRIPSGTRHSSSPAPKKVS